MRLPELPTRAGYIASRTHLYIFHLSRIMYDDASVSIS